MNYLADFPNNTIRILFLLSIITESSSVACCQENTASQVPRKYQLIATPFLWEPDPKEGLMPTAIEFNSEGNLLYVGTIQDEMVVLAVPELKEVARVHFPESAGNVWGIYSNPSRPNDVLIHCKGASTYNSKDGHRSFEKLWRWNSSTGLSVVWHGSENQDISECHWISGEECFLVGAVLGPRNPAMPLKSESHAWKLNINTMEITQEFSFSGIQAVMSSVAADGAIAVLCVRDLKGAAAAERSLTNHYHLYVTSNFDINFENIFDVTTHQSNRTPRIKIGRDGQVFTFVTSQMASADSNNFKHTLRRRDDRFPIDEFESRFDFQSIHFVDSDRSILLIGTSQDISSESIQKKDLVESRISLVEAKANQVLDSAPSSGSLKTSAFCAKTRMIAVSGLNRVDGEPGRYSIQLWNIN